MNMSGSTKLLLVAVVAVLSCARAFEAETDCKCTSFRFFGVSRSKCKYIGQDPVQVNHLKCMARAVGIDPDDNNVLLSDVGNNQRLIGPAASMQTLMTVDMRARDISELSSDTFDVPKLIGHITELDLAENSIYEIDSSALNKLVRLRVLDLSDNIIERIGESAFSEMSELESLNFEINNIEYINMQMFEGLNELKRLNLHSNYIEDLGFSPFMELSALISLDLSENALSTINQYHFIGVPELESLELSWNDIRTIGPNTFASLTNLKKLYLTHNQLRVIDESTFLGLENLEILHLHHNEIYTLKGAPFKDMKGLRELNLAGNNLRTLKPTPFQSLPSLESIDLSHNRFDEDTYLPVEMAGDKHTRLIQLAKFFCMELESQSPNLHSVNLQRNNFRFLFRRLRNTEIKFDGQQRICSFD